MSDVNPNAGTGTVEQPFYAGFADPELKGWVETMKPESVEKFAQGYRELQKFTGVPAERLIKLPEKPDDPGWAEARAKLGFVAPDDPAGYELEVPEGFDADYANAMAGKAKELGVPKAMLQELAKFNNEFARNALAAQEKAIEDGVTAAKAALRAEWGSKFDASMTLGLRAQEHVKATLGVDDVELKAMMDAAPRAYYKLLAFHGQQFGEAEVIGGDGKSAMTHNLSPEAATARLAALKADPTWAQAVIAGDAKAVAEHRALIAAANTR